MLPFADTPPIPGLAAFPELPCVPGSRMMFCCQSGDPVCGRDCNVSCGSVVESSADAVCMSGASDVTCTSCAACATPIFTSSPSLPTWRTIGPRCEVANPSLEKVMCSCHPEPTGQCHTTRLHWFHTYE